MMTMTKLHEINKLPNNKATKPRSTTCAYCGKAESVDEPLTDDHVVGRKFVPKGSFASGWLLIVRACNLCNNIKADLEDEISAITLQPELGSEHGDSDLSEIAKRKAEKSISRATRKPIAESHTSLSMKGKLMQIADIGFTMIAPAQIDENRVMKLAWYHVQGFFHTISFDNARRAGGIIPGKFVLVDSARSSDWGNSLQRSFAEEVKEWNTRAVGTGANGYFRIAIRREPGGAAAWSFALEWNRNLRTIGFFGDIEAAQPYLGRLKPLTMHQLGPNCRFRAEECMPEGVDVLFFDPSLGSED